MKLLERKSIRIVIGCSASIGIVGLLFVSELPPVLGGILALCGFLTIAATIAYVVYDCLTMHVKARNIKGKRR